MDYEEIRKIVKKQFADDLQKQKPKTAAEIKAEALNPMQKDKKTEVYNAIFCYDEENNICGYYIQPRIEENELYKYRFYIPVVDALWKGVRKSEDLPDKKVKIGYDGDFQSQNELLKKNDIKLAEAMIINFSLREFVYLGEGFIGITEPDILYYLLCRFKYAGYPINDATKRLNSSKLFV